MSTPPSPARSRTSRVDSSERIKEGARRLFSKAKRATRAGKFRRGTEEALQRSDDMVSIDDESATNLAAAAAALADEQAKATAKAVEEAQLEANSPPPSPRGEHSESDKHAAAAGGLSRLTLPAPFQGRKKERSWSGVGNILNKVQDGVGYFRTFKPQKTEGLDLSYIPFTAATGAEEDVLKLDISNARIIAMCGLTKGIGVSALIRNRVEDVAAFMDAHHPEHYVIFNLTETPHSPAVRKAFHERTRHLPVPDHNVPSFMQLWEFCVHADRYLKEDSRNVIAVHCKAGKGRTGTFICSFLLYIAACTTVPEALRVFAEHRSTPMDKENGGHRGVDQASQVRWISHFHDLIHQRRLRYRDFKALSTFQRTLTRVVVHAPANVEKDIDTPVLVVKSWGLPGRVLGRFVRTGLRKDTVGDTWATFDMGKGVAARGETKVEFWEAGRVKDSLAYRLWFHPYLVEQNTLLLRKEQIDDVWNSKHVSPDFSIQLFFQEGSGLSASGHCIGEKSLGNHKVKQREEASLKSATNEEDNGGSGDGDSVQILESDGHGVEDRQNAEDGNEDKERRREKKRKKKIGHPPGQDKVSSRVRNLFLSMELHGSDDETSHTTANQSGSRAGSRLALDSRSATPGFGRDEEEGAGRWEPDSRIDELDCGGGSGRSGDCGGGDRGRRRGGSVGVDGDGTEDEAEAGDESQSGRSSPDVRGDRGVGTQTEDDDGSQICMQKAGTSSLSPPHTLPGSFSSLGRRQIDADDLTAEVDPLGVLLGGRHASISLVEI